MGLSSYVRKHPKTINFSLKHPIFVKIFACGSQNYVTSQIQKFWISLTRGGSIQWNSTDGYIILNFSDSNLGGYGYTILDPFLAFFPCKTAKNPKFFRRASRANFGSWLHYSEKSSKCFQSW